MNRLANSTPSQHTSRVRLRRLAQSVLLALCVLNHPTLAVAHDTSRLLLQLAKPEAEIRISQKGSLLLCELPHVYRVSISPSVPSEVLAITRKEGCLRLTLREGCRLSSVHNKDGLLTLTFTEAKKAQEERAESHKLHIAKPKHSNVRLSVADGDRPLNATAASKQNGQPKAGLSQSLQGMRTIPYSELLKLAPETFPPHKSTKAKKWDLFSFLGRFFVAEAQAAEAADPRIVRIAPQDIRAQINTQGPEAWPEDKSLSTRTDMPDPEAKPEPPKPRPLSPEESFLDPNERREATGSSFISEPLSPGDQGGKEKAQDPSRPFPKHETPTAINPAENRPFPKNEAPAAVNPAEDRPFPKHEAPAAVESSDRPFPKNETPAAVGDPTPFPKHETPAAVGDPKPFPKNETPAAVGDPKPFPKNETPASAEQAKPQEPQPQQPAHTSESQVHGRVNTEQPGVVQEAPKEPEKPEEREVIYVDENGNPVEKPLDIKALMSEVSTLMEQKKYDDALIILDKLKASERLDAETLEQVLYAISDCYWYRYEKDPIAGFDVIVSTTSEALNYNLRSARVPDALLRLCQINLSVDNTLDAEGYISAILRRYPVYPGTPVGLTQLANAFLKKKKYAQAEKFYSLVLDKFPESSQLKDASVGLINVFYHEKKYDRARLILDFVNKRWPRHYLDNPAFLLLQASIEKEFKQTERQVATLWQLYNLQPSHEQTVPMFMEMADIYLKARNFATAEFLYQEILKRAPESSEGLTAALRLAEKGFYESPLNFETMFALFGRGSKPPFRELYQDLAARSRTNPDAILARLKLAMWLLWDKDYPQAMGKAADFIDEYPEHPDKPLAQEIIWKAFQQELALALSEQNYARILTLWNGFPLVRARYGAPDSKLRFALAQGQRERGDEEGALNLMRTFLKSPMDPDYGEIAFLEFFNRYLSEGNWAAILDLGKTVQGWNLKPEVRQDLNYAMALSAQNLDLAGTALAIWRRIAQDPAAQTYQKAWAMVFIAQDAERRKDIREAYAANLKVVELFSQLAEERSDKADPERIKTAMLSLMDICEVANHIPEALQWVNRFRPYAPENSVDYPALRYRESRLYRKLGDTNRSQALLEEIIRHFPDSPYAQAARSELETFQISRDLQSLQPQKQAQSQ